MLLMMTVTISAVDGVCFLEGALKYLYQQPDDFNVSSNEITIVRKLLREAKQKMIHEQKRATLDSYLKAYRFILNKELCAT